MRLVEAPAARRQQQQRPRRLHGLDRGEQRLRHHHHARAAAERRVVDACGARRSCNRAGRARARRASPRSRARPSSDSSSGPVEILGEDREHVDAHGDQLESQRPSGRSTTTTPGSCATTNTHRDERAAVEHEQVVRGVRLHRVDRAEARAGAVAHSEPISSCTQSSRLRCGSGVGVEHGCPAALGRVAVVDAGERARPSGAGAGARLRTTSSRSPTHRAWNPARSARRRC